MKKYIESSAIEIKKTQRNIKLIDVIIEKLSGGLNRLQCQND